MLSSTGGSAYCVRCNRGSRGRCRARGAPSPALQRRILHAVDLLQRGYAAYLLATGGVGRYPPAEAAVMQRLAVAQGIPSQHVLCEDRPPPRLPVPCGVVSYCGSTGGRVCW